MKKVGRYVVISELGRGANGIVYKASDPTIGREVALKVISLSSSPEEGASSAQQMFMREVRAAGRLAHPSIVTIHDAFDDKENQTSCIVMELVRGMTLEKILDTGNALSADQTLNLVRQVAEGLDYAHRNQVIHRDLKPANILVTEDGRAKITDFGIAKVLAREGVARTVGVMGTPSYMSPEQVRGGEVDARTDIFSLGIILFTMLSGKKPFVGNTAAVMFKIVYEEPVVPSSLNRQLTPAHDHVIRKCLAKDRNQRYSSARELLGDLDDLEHGRPPRSQAAAPAPAPTAPPAPAAAPPADGTMAMSISELMKAASTQLLPPAAPPAPRSAPPPRVATPPPKPASPPPVARVGVSGPVTPAPTNETVAMPISELMKAASRQPSAHSAPAAPRSASPPRVAAPPPKPASPPYVAPVGAGGPVTPAPKDGTVAMPISELMKAASQTPSPRAVPAPPARIDSPLMERTLPMQVPDLSAASSRAPSFPRAVPVPPAPPDFPLMERTLPMQAPDLSAAAQPFGSQPDAPVALPPPFAVGSIEPETTPGAVLPPPKSKLIPVMFGGVAVVLLAAVMWGYWKFHQTRTAPPQVAVQAQPAAPLSLPTPVATPPPVESPTPPPAAAEQPAPRLNAAPEVAKKPTVHRTKQVTALHPSAPAPAPPPVQPQPVVVTPPPQPLPATPSPEAMAKAEAAKVASIPRIVQVSCNSGLKEATFTFSSGGQILLAESLKGKKKKEGFLGIKGSYQGSFSHTITVPAGASQVSVRVVARDGATDVSKTINLPPPGGFVPTLAVEADNEHVSLNWQSSPASK
jgi:serine/threonine-protein kinase